MTLKWKSIDEFPGAELQASNKCPQVFQYDGQWWFDEGYSVESCLGPFETEQDAINGLVTFVEH